MRKFLLAAGLILSALCGTAASQEKSRFDVTPGFKISPAAAPVVNLADPWYACRISVRLVDATSYGSGTLLAAENGKTVVLTNAHVVRDNANPISVHLNGKTYPAKYVIGSVVTDLPADPVTGTQGIHVDGPDLAVLEVDADLGGVTLADDVPAVGETVFQMGYGGSTDGKPVMRSGVVIKEKFSGRLNSTIPSVQGDSGCGVFNKDGQLVGVTFGGTGTVSLAETVTTVRTYVLQSDKKFVLFPRLRARLEAAREARAQRRAEAAQPAPEWSFDQAPKAAQPAPRGDGVPPRPPGDGWQWDATRKLWWKWVTPPLSRPVTSVGQPYFPPGSGFQILPPQANCPTGTCPLQKPKK